MIALDQLDCKIFVESPMRRDELARTLLGRIQSSVEFDLTGSVLRYSFAEVEIRNNEDACSDRAADFPDGFLYFRYCLEVYVDPTSQEKISLVSAILKTCWENGWPAVAACDYEQVLPELGGHNSQQIPWPGVAIAVKV